MSTLRTNAITDAAGTGAPDFPNGLTGTVPASSITGALNATGSAPIYACRAWVNFNGTGTVAIRASGNVSSITDQGVGAYFVNFATAMQDANYAVVTGHSGGTTTNPSSISSFVQSTTSFQLQTHQGANLNFDQDQCHVAVFR
jgi:hypothetical protein